MATLEENRQQALDWVNALRTEWGMSKLDELPQGLHGQRTDCVLGRALKCSHFSVVAFAGDGTMTTLRWSDKHYGFATGMAIPTSIYEREVHKIPDEVATFECDFERGFYPDLVDDNPLYRSLNSPYWGMPTAEDSPIADEVNLVGIA